MFLKLFEALTKWIGYEAEKATEAAIMNGAQRGAERAMLRLTGGTVDANRYFDHGPETLTTDEPEKLEESAPVQPMELTRTEIHGMKRDDLELLIAEQGWKIDLEANVRDLKEAIFEQLEI